MGPLRDLVPARISTVRVAAAAIGAAHRARGADDPTALPAVRAVVARIVRQHAAHSEAAPRQAAPLSLESAVLLIVSSRNNCDWSPMGTTGGA